MATRWDPVLRALGTTTPVGQALATPLLVSLRERTELVRTHTRRVLNRRRPTGEKSRAVVDDVAADDAEGAAEKETVAASAASGKHSVAEKPAPGVRPVRPNSSRTGRPAGKRNTRRK